MMRARTIRPVPGFRLVRDPPISPKELHAFYVRTGVCEAGFTPREVGRVLTRSDVVLGVYRGKQLVGFARGLCDGLAGHVAELCVDPAFQGKPNRHANASVVEGDHAGIGRWLGASLLRELRRLGATFFSVYVIQGIEERFYRSIGFEQNTGHAMYYIDDRRYVLKARRGGKLPRLARARRS